MACTRLVLLPPAGLLIYPVIGASDWIVLWQAHLKDWVFAGRVVLHSVLFIMRVIFVSTRGNKVTFPLSVHQKHLGLYRVLFRVSSSRVSHLAERK